MAIAYKEEALPKVATFPFDITHWKGVNKIKANRYDQEMADCRNMSVDNYPYASPRKPRKKVVDEQGVKRIYKVDGDTLYYIDKDDCLCFYENGSKTNLQYENENSEMINMNVGNTTCTNNYDGNSIFYPSMNYVDYKGEFVQESDMIQFDVNVLSNSEYPMYIFNYTSKAVPIANTSMNQINLKMIVQKSNDGSYGYTRGRKVYICAYLFDIEGKNKLTGTTDVFNGNQVAIGDFEKVQRNSLWCLATIENKMNEYTLEVPDSIRFEDGDYMRFVLYTYYPGGNVDYTSWLRDSQIDLSHAAEEADWYLQGMAEDTCKLGYGVVYNNRIVGVWGNDIRASALGDFTNFWKFADEAGNPSATGAYATDVGSAGNFTGICVYNNMVMLFKKNLVYEMYGSMPYNISELCATGCIDNDSICEIDGVLYWASPKGIVRYSGGVPTVISYEIDIDTSGMCKAGTDGRKYYVYDGKKIFVYDTLYRVWHIEDEKEVQMFYGESNELYMVSNDGIYKLNCGEENVEWEFETKDFTFNSEERKNLSKLWIRAEMSRQSRLEVYVRQNSGEWTRSAVKTAEKDEMFDFKLRIKKCDSFALKFKGVGDVRILDVHGKVTVGTSKHRSGASLNVYR